MCHRRPSALMTVHLTPKARAGSGIRYRNGTSLLIHRWGAVSDISGYGWSRECVLLLLLCDTSTTECWKESSTTRGCSLGLRRNWYRKRGVALALRQGLAFGVSPVSVAGVSVAGVSVRVVAFSTAAVRKYRALPPREHGHESNIFDLKFFPHGSFH